MIGFVLANSVDPDDAAFQLGLPCLLNYLVLKGLNEITIFSFLKAGKFCMFFVVCSFFK